MRPYIRHTLELTGVALEGKAINLKNTLECISGAKKVSVAENAENERIGVYSGTCVLDGEINPKEVLLTVNNLGYFVIRSIIRPSQVREA